jgi:hypothetical protein
MYTERSLTHTPHKHCTNNTTPHSLTTHTPHTQTKWFEVSHTQHTHTYIYM